MVSIRPSQRTLRATQPPEYINIGVQMISVTVSNATLILGSRAIFRDLNWEIQHDQKIGFIGPNGAGKSSLFKLIIGEYSPEKGGTLIRAKGVTVGYLPQH